ncbi:MAG: DUF3667 domain-containing protein [Betaproteobacteria bacterium]|nr:DUF3667 domain-containing protein [Betaproteobacteria bacterium]
MTQTAAVPAYCRNCSLFLGVHPGNFCPHCGQDTAPHPPSAWEFLHEFVGHYVALEGRLARTLALLIFRPGELTRRYLAGKKNSYVLPLRLYLTTSIVFFLIVKIFGLGNMNTTQTGAEADGANNIVAISDQPLHPKRGMQIGKSGPPVVVGGVDQKQLQKPFLNIIECETSSVQCNKVKAYLKDKYHDKTASEVGRQVLERTFSLAPYAMFFFLPVFALLTKILYFNRRMYYGEHLVYAFHVHSFAFLLLLVAALIPKSISDFLYLAGMLYFWFAMRRVFGGGWFSTTCRYLFISIFYPILLSVVVLLTLTTAVFV